MTKNRSGAENSGRKSIGRQRKGASFPAPRPGAIAGELRRRLRGDQETHPHRTSARRASRERGAGAAVLGRWPGNLGPPGPRRLGCQGD